MIVLKIDETEPLTQLVIASGILFSLISIAAISVPYLSGSTNIRISIERFAVSKGNLFNKI
ncbi:MAG: hypothetical protein NPINA01_10240 [Nitrospinaceae bacterium]|nr:MAG: hypothetical protein NPINA01_10240 [Nitrospinaceae bacterium]